MTERQQVIDALCRPFPREAIKQNQGRDYVSGTSVIYRLNAATNYDWEFEITGHELVGGADSQGNKPAQVVYGRMRIPVISNGWRADMGTQALENSKDDHEAYKGAATDCMKRCARQFGVGLHLWGPDIEAGSAPVQRAAPRQQAAPSAQREMPQERGNIAPGVGMTDQQRKAIWAIAKNELRWSDEDVERESKSVFGVELKALDKQQASTLIESLKKMAEHEFVAPEPHPVVQQAMDNNTANWIAAMEGAANMAELSKKANEALAANAMTDPVRAIFNKRRDLLQEQQLITN